MEKYKVGLSFGVFDIFHSGHKRLLDRAKKLCEELIVFVSSDDYVFKYKGHVPVHSLAERREIIARYVPGIDLQIQSLNYSKKEAVADYKPNVLIVGDDWDKKTYTGEGLGVPVVYLPHTPKISTTIIRKNAQHRLP